MLKEEMEFIKNREEFTIGIRKENRNEIFNRKRMKGNSRNFQQSGQRYMHAVVVEQKYRQIVEELQQKNYIVSQIDEMCFGLDSVYDENRLRAIMGLRKIISEDLQEPYLQRIIDNGTLSKLIAIMKDRRYPQLQFESCWIATNIAYGSSTQCEAIVAKDGLDAFMQLLYENIGPLLEQALWGLGNIAGDCHNCRNTVIMKGGVQCVIRIIKHTQNKMVMELGAWVLSNLCSGEPLPNYELIKSALPVIGELIVRGVVQGKVLNSCLWALCHHSEHKKAKIRLILKIEHIVIKMIDLCYSKDLDIVIPALRLLGNISTGSQSQANQLLNNNILELLLRLMGHKKKTVRRQTCWLLSNICAGTLPQVQKCLFYPDMLAKLMYLFKNDQADVKRQITYVFGNMCHLGNPEEIYQGLTHCHFLQELFALLILEESVKMLDALLKCLYQLLVVGSKIGKDNLVLLDLKRMPGMLDRIETLQYHQDQSVYAGLLKLFERFLTMEIEPSIL